MSGWARTSAWSWPHAGGHSDARDSALALRRTVALYRRVAERTTNFYGLDVRVDSQKVADEIEAILSSGNI